MKIGATKVAETVVGQVFPIPRHLCVANVAWSLLPYEADLLVMTQSGYMVEVEIKVSLADLKRDASKHKWSTQAFTTMVSRFYYAMPAALWEKPAAQEAVRPGAGVIVVEKVEHDRHGRVLEARVEREAVRTGARALTARERFDLARVGSYRAWSPQQRHRLRQLRAEHKLAERERAERWERFRKGVPA